jgi:biotin/methionine sulfoxide reductase
MQRAIEPQGQARSDYDIFSQLAKRLDIEAAYTEQRSEMEWLRHLYETQRREVLRWDIELPAFDVFWTKGFVELPAPEPGQEAVLYEDFRKNPGGSPLRTPTGKIELFSQTIAGFRYDDCPGHPTWLAPKEWLGSTLAATYPLHLLTFQPATRLHSQMDHGRVSLASKVNGREPVYIHPADAAERGIADGDIVRLFNQRGQCLAGARLTEDFLRHVIGMATGAWFDLETPGLPGSLEVHGNPNVLTRDAGTSKLSQGPSAQSCLVEMEKWNGSLPPIKAHDPPQIDAT